MGRIHLFEFEDQDWFPRIFRNYGTDFLQFLSNKTRMLQPVVPLLIRGIKSSRHPQIVDLASGGGGGLIGINSALKEVFPDLKIVLTDYYPNLPAFEYAGNQADNIEYVKEKVDARNVPENLLGLRTQFLSFHHFKPGDARKILQNAVDTQHPIAIFEAQERSFKSMLAMFLSPITVWLLTPFIRPFKLGRILFTYLLPLVPLFVWWDGLVSALRTYSILEMEGLVAGLNNKEEFDWKMGKVKSGPGVILYLLGTKKREDHIN